MSIEATVIALCAGARAAARGLATAATAAKNDALGRAAQKMRVGTAELLSANGKDVDGARRAGLTAALIDRLTLTEKRIDAMASGLEEIARLPDPVGETIARWRRPNGLEISQVRIPIGVVGMIYESRPNVTADAAGLCLKSGNAVILKGGSESFASNQLIAKLIGEVGSPGTELEFAL